MPLRLIVKIALILLVSCAARTGVADISVVDDRNNVITLNGPVQRIVSLAPHLAEHVFAAGAGDKLVAVVEYSDFPAEAKAIERIGDAFRLDFERIVKLKPDIILAWASGNRSGDIERLRELGLTVYLSEPSTLEAIAVSLEKIGTLAGTEATATEAARRYRERLDPLTYPVTEDHDRIRVFYQIWDAPLMTINGDHLINEVIHRCGGLNIFASLGSLTPQISREAVVVADPEIILSASADQNDRWTAPWQSLEAISAVRTDALITLQSDVISRASPRIVDGVRQLCEAIASVRATNRSQ